MAIIGIVIIFVSDDFKRAFEPFESSGKLKSGLSDDNLPFQALNCHRNRIGFLILMRAGNFRTAILIGKADMW